MGEIPVHLLYTLLGIFSFICSLSVVLFKVEKNRCHWIIAALLFVWSLKMIVYAQLFNPDRYHMIWTWPVYIITSLLYAPLFYLFSMELTDLKGITRRDYMVFIPTAAITVLFLFIYLGASPGSLREIHDNVIVNGIYFSGKDKTLSIIEYLCFHTARTVTFWFEAGIMLWGCWNLYKYEDIVNDYFSSSYGKSVNQARIIAIYTVIGAVVVLTRESRPDLLQEINVQKFILTLTSFLFQLALTVMAFSIDYSADDIRHMIETEEENKQQFKPVYSEKRQEMTIFNCWYRLEQLMNEEKVFKNPELNLIDLAQRLGTNRTYLSTAVKQFSGKSFSDYVNHARIMYAQELLLRGESAKNVAYSCGYVSSSTFYRQFQKVTGMAPSVWLQNQRRPRE